MTTKPEICDEYAKVKFLGHQTSEKVLLKSKDVKYDRLPGYLIIRLLNNKNDIL